MVNNQGYDLKSYDEAHSKPLPIGSLDRCGDCTLIKGGMIGKHRTSQDQVTWRKEHNDEGPANARSLPHSAQG